MTEPEEDRSAAGARWGWVIAVGIALGLIAWGLAHYAFVRDAPREWNFGELEDTPARSAYSTTQPSMSPPPPRQLPVPPKAAKKPPTAPPAPGDQEGGTP